MRKLITIYLLALVIFSCAFVLLIKTGAAPDKLITGTWQEMDWQYEDTAATISRDRLLTVHQAEKWEFSPDGLLELCRQNQEKKTLRWSIKGRGHILEISNNSGFAEHYNIETLSPHFMILNYELDMEVRGIAKLTFKR